MHIPYRGKTTGIAQETSGRDSRARLSTTKYARFIAQIANHKGSYLRVEPETGTRLKIR